METLRRASDNGNGTGNLYAQIEQLEGRCVQLQRAMESR